MHWLITYLKNGIESTDLRKMLFDVKLLFTNLMKFLNQAKYWSLQAKPCLLLSFLSNITFMEQYIQKPLKETPFLSKLFFCSFSFLFSFPNAQASMIIKCHSLHVLYIMHQKTFSFCDFYYLPLQWTGLDRCHLIY